jgi:hypothetical protein
MKCSVCKVTNQDNWTLTSERAPISRTQILFRLFELTKSEFSPGGAICLVCYELLAQVDSLEFQTQELIKTLKARVNCCATPGDYTAATARESDRKAEAANDHDSSADGVDLSNNDEENQHDKRESRKRKRDAIQIQLLTTAEKKRKIVGVDHGNDSLPARKREARGSVNSSVADGEFEDDLDVVDPFDSFVSESSELVEETSETIGRMPRTELRSGRNMSAGNLDFNITMTKTSRGGDQLIYEGYTYRSKYRKMKEVGNWVCSAYRSQMPNSCLAKIRTALGASCILLDSMMEHNHAQPDESRLKLIMFKERVKEIAKNHPEMEPHEILTSVQMLHGIPKTLGIRNASILRIVSREKNRHNFDGVKTMKDRRINGEKDEDGFVTEGSESRSVEKAPETKGKITRTPSRSGLNKSANNLDFNITMTKTIRGGNQLIYEGYTYRSKYRKINDNGRWMCSAYRSQMPNSCHAKIRSALDASCILLDSKMEHNHAPPDESRLKLSMFKEQVKQIVKNHPDMESHEILASVQMLHGIPKTLGILDTSVVRIVGRQKKRQSLEDGIKTAKDGMNEATLFKGQEGSDNTGFNSL